MLLKKNVNFKKFVVICQRILMFLKISPRQTKQRETGNQKSVIIFYKPEPEKSFISRNLLTTAKTLKYKCNFNTCVHDNNCLYWKENKLFFYIFNNKFFTVFLFLWVQWEIPFKRKSREIEWHIPRAVSVIATVMPQ